MNDTNLIHDERGVSETIGYVLLVSVVFASVISVIGMGIPAMNQKQHAIYMQNVERAFETFADNLDDSVFNLAPARSTVLKLHQGSLFDNTTSTMQITVINESGGRSTVTVYSTPIVYEKSGSFVTYTYGAVITGKTRSGGIVQDKPPFIFSHDYVSLPIIVTTIPKQDIGTSFTGKVTIVGRRQGNTIHRIPTDEEETTDATLYVNISSPYYKAWGQYFRQQGLTHVMTNETTNTVSYKITTDDIYIKEVLIRVSSSR